jgi:hypothetical protein
MKHSDGTASIITNKMRNRQAVKRFRLKHSAAEFRRIVTERDNIQRDLDVACGLIDDLRNQLAVAKARSEAEEIEGACSTNASLQEYAVAPEIKTEPREMGG